MASRGPLRLSPRAAVAQVANDMASDQFCETTIGYKVPPLPPAPPPAPPPALLPASRRLCLLLGCASAHLLYS